MSSGTLCKTCPLLCDFSLFLVALAITATPASWEGTDLFSSDTGARLFCILFFFSFFIFVFFLPHIKDGIRFHLCPGAVRHPTAFLSFLLQPARRGRSRPARARGSARRAPPTAAPPPRPRRSARAAMATTGRISTRRRLPAPVSNSVGVGRGGCRVSLRSAAGDAAGIKSHPVSFFIWFSPPVLLWRGVREWPGGRLAASRGQPTARV